MEITIRRATAADYGALCRVLQEADRLHGERLSQLRELGYQTVTRRMARKSL